MIYLTGLWFWPSMVFRSSSVKHCLSRSHRVVVCCAVVVELYPIHAWCHLFLPPVWDWHQMSKVFLAGSPPGSRGNQQVQLHGSWRLLRFHHCVLCERGIVTCVQLCCVLSSWLPAAASSRTSCWMENRSVFVGLGFPGGSKGVLFTTSSPF